MDTDRWPAWRPISEAPRDGTVIDIWRVNEDGTGERIPNAYWDESGCLDMWRRYGEFDETSEYVIDPRNARPCWMAPGLWLEGEDGPVEPIYRREHADVTAPLYKLPPGDVYQGAVATHWLPLPPAPDAAKENTP
jgi:hypothetical protein